MTRRVVSTTGRKLGARALETRRQLMETTAELLSERSVLDVSVVEIARRAGTSAATFYQYFEDVDSVALRLAERAAEEMPAISASMKGDWEGEAGLRLARDLVRAFLDHWEHHHAVLTLRNLAAERGDSRFRRVRKKAISPVLEGLAEIIERNQSRGRIREEIHARVAATALMAILERMSSNQKVLSGYSLGRDDLIETCAQIIFSTVSGRGVGAAE